MTRMRNAVLSAFRRIPAERLHHFKRGCQRVRENAALGVAAISGAGAVGTGAVAWYTFSSVHASRKRGYTDEFVLTPEDLNMPYQEVQFFTEDGVSLTGWYIPQSSGGRPSRRVIVCCHPYNNSKSNLLGVARGLWDRRYSVFLFDFRSFAHTPTRQSIGYYEQRDARAAIKCARSESPEGSCIALSGASMGGAVALLVGHEEEADVVGIATDCAFASLSDVLEARVRRATRLPAPLAALVVKLADATSCLLRGYSFGEVAPTAAVANGPRAGKVPLLILHAESDEVVPVSQAHSIFSAAIVPDDLKQLVVVQHCQHVGCFFQDRPGYIRQLANFFDAAFQAVEDEQSPVFERSPSSRRRLGSASSQPAPTA